MDPGRLTYWHVRWVIPAAVLDAARRLAPGNPRAGLELIAEKGETWARAIAKELLADRDEYEALLRDLEGGATVSEELVARILERVGKPGNAVENVVELEIHLVGPEEAVNRIVDELFGSREVRVLFTRLKWHRREG